MPPNEAISFPRRSLRRRRTRDSTSRTSSRSRRREPVVEPVHLELPLEVRDHAEALHHRAGAVLGRSRRRSSLKTSTTTFSTSATACSRNATRSSTEKVVCLCCGSRTTPTTTVEDRRSPADDVDVPERDEVEGPGVDGNDRRTGHGRKSVSRAEPYRRDVTWSSGSVGSTRASVSTATRPEATTTSGRSARPHFEIAPALVRRVEQDEVVAPRRGNLLAQDRERIALEHLRARQPERLEVLADHAAGGAVGLGAPARRRAPRARARPTRRRGPARPRPRRGRRG